MRPLRLARLPMLMLVLIALVGAGCGDSDDGRESSSSNQAGATPDERQIRSTVDGLYADLADYDAAAVCDRMSPHARKQIAEGGADRSGAADCAASFQEFLDEAKRNGGLKRTLTAKVGKVEIDGDKAAVTVTFGPQAGQIPLRKIDGEWKIGVALATPSTEPPSSSSGAK